MKRKNSISINSIKLHAMTSRLSRVVKRSSPDIMRDFLVRYSSGVFSITAINPNVAAVETAKVVCDFENELTFIVDASSFSAFAKSVVGEDKDVDDLTIVYEENEAGNKKIITIIYPSGSIRMPVSGGGSFPAVYQPKVQWTSSEVIKVDGSILSQMIKYVLPCVHDDGLRPILNNVFVGINNGVLNVVGCCSAELRHCSCAEHAINMDVSTNKDIILTPDLCDIIQYYISNIRSVSIIYEDSRTFFKMGPAYVYQINPEGQYPNYTQLTSKCDESSCTQSFIVDRQDFLFKINRIAVASQSIFTISIDENRSLLENDYAEGDIAMKEEFEYTKVEGHEGFCLSFNIRKFKNFLENLESDNIEIKKSDIARCAFAEEVDSMGINKFFMLMSFLNLNRDN